MMKNLRGTDSACDLGTKGGIVTDDHARVLKDDGTLFEGLYAIDNNSAISDWQYLSGSWQHNCSFMPFGYIAAKHLADGKIRPSSQEA